MLKRQSLRFYSFRPTSAFNWGFMDSTMRLPSHTHPFSSLHGSGGGSSSTNAAYGSYPCGGLGNGSFRNALSLKGFFNFNKFNKGIDSGAPQNRGGSVFALRPQSVQNLRIGLQDWRDSDRANGQEVCHPGNPLGFPYHTKFDKAVVAVDVDEVLGNFVSALNRFIADRYSLNHSVSEYHVYEFFKIWKCSRDEADIRVHEFFKTPYFKTGIHPIPGAREALDKLSKFCNLCVVTSRQNTIKDHTVDWLDMHYPGLFQGMHFGNHFALDGESRRKSDICRSVGAQYLIDDNPRYAIECAEAGIRVLLFDYENSYPWAKSHDVDQHPLVTKVRNWQEVEQQLISWVAA